LHSKTHPRAATQPRQSRLKLAATAAQVVYVVVNKSLSRSDTPAAFAALATVFLPIKQTELTILLYFFQKYCIFHFLFVILRAK
jgi:hypothetical protein